MHEMKKTIEQIERMMAPSLNQSQSELLHAVLQHCLDDETIESDARAAASNDEMLSAFLSAKREQ